MRRSNEPDIADDMRTIWDAAVMVAIVASLLQILSLALAVADERWISTGWHAFCLAGWVLVAHVARRRRDRYQGLSVTITRHLRYPTPTPRQESGDE